MADVPKRAGLGRPAIVAIGFAIVALLTSLVAVVVVARRPASERAPVAATASERRRNEHPSEQTIDASEVMKLKRDVVEKAVDDKGTAIGVRVKDEAVRTALGLEPDDIITSLNGRKLAREFDVYDAVLGMSMMDATIVYAEIVRDKQPSLLRWKIEGQLRTARRDPLLAPNPFTGPRDPLVDTVKRIDALHYEVPRATVDKILADPDAYVRKARLVPSIRAGQPNGFKLYAILPTSMYAAIGLGPGDTLRAVNGMDLSTPDPARQPWSKLKDAPVLEILVLRRSGVEETIIITVK